MAALGRKLTLAQAVSFSIRHQLAKQYASEDFGWHSPKLSRFDAELRRHSDRSTDYLVTGGAFATAHSSATQRRSPRNRLLRSSGANCPPVGPTAFLRAVHRRDYDALLFDCKPATHHPP